MATDLRAGAEEGVGLRGAHIVLDGIPLRERWVVTSPPSRCKVTTAVCAAYQSVFQENLALLESRQSNKCTCTISAMPTSA